jgi:hypothetical protein
VEINNKKVDYSFFGSVHRERRHKVLSSSSPHHSVSREGDESRGKDEISLKDL